MIAAYEKGTIVRIGFDPDEKVAYLMIAHADWHSVETGKKYTATFQFDNEAPWEGTGIGLREDKQKGRAGVLRFGFNKTQFAADLAQRNGLTIRYNQKIVARISLSGSSVAMKEVLICQKTIDANRPASEQRTEDPFERR
jgi:hypothetical protein